MWNISVEFSALKREGLWKSRKPKLFFYTFDEETDGQREVIWGLTLWSGD